MSQRKLCRIGIDTNDAPGSGLTCPLNDGEADAAKTEDRNSIAFFYFGRIMNSANTGCHTAAKQTDFFKGSCWINFGQGNFWNNPSRIIASAPPL